MNLIRILKLKKLNGELDNLDEPTLEIFNTIVNAKVVKLGNYDDFHFKSNYTPDNIAKLNDTLDLPPFISFNRNLNILYYSTYMIGSEFEVKYNLTPSKFNKILIKLFHPYFTRNNVIIKRMG